MADVKYEGEPVDCDKVLVVMPNKIPKNSRILIPPNIAAEGLLERRLGIPDDITVKQEKERLLNGENYPRSTFEEYEMIIIGPQNSVLVMDDNFHIGCYRNDLCQGADTHLEIRKRPLVQGQRVSGPNREPNQSQPERLNVNLK